MTEIIEHIKSGGAVTTRDGRAVTIYTTDAPGDFPIHGRIEGRFAPEAWTADGERLTARVDGRSDSDLMIPKPPIYVNVYRFANGALDATAHPTRTAADESACSPRSKFLWRIACIRVEEDRIDD